MPAPDGAQLAVTVTGRGPSLLLIPGLGATRVIFAPLLPLLASSHSVIVYDQRGVGESDVTDGPYTTEQLAGDAAAVLDAIGASRAAVLGASFGGMVAQQLAVNHAPRVSVLILAATGPGRNRLVEAPAPEAAAALLGRGARTPADAYRIACTVMYSRRFQGEHADLIDEQVRERAARPVAARGFQAQHAASLSHDAWDDLADLTMPALVMHGSEDEVMPLANARALAAQIPRARLEVFDGCGHLFFHEAPQRTAALVAEAVGGG